MKELIFCISFVTLFVLLFSWVIYIVSHRRLSSKAPRYHKTLRNLFIGFSICTFLLTVCLPSFSLSYLFFPILSTPIFLIDALQQHLIMKRVEETNKVKEKLMKYQPIDVEYRELS